MSSDPLDRVRKLARDVALGPPARSSGQDPDATPGLNPAVVRVLRTGGAVVLGSELLRRSRLARLAAAAGAVTYAGRKRSGGDGWQDVQAPDARPR